MLCWLMTHFMGWCVHDGWAHLWGDIVAAAHNGRQAHARFPAIRQKPEWLQLIERVPIHPTADAGPKKLRSAPAAVLAQVLCRASEQSFNARRKPQAYRLWATCVR